MKFISKLFLAVLTALGFASAALAATFAAPPGSSIDWTVDEKTGDATVTVKGMDITAARHFLGEGQDWGKVIKIKVDPGPVQVFKLPNVPKNGLRLNVMKGDLWLYIRCPAEDGHFPVTEFKAGPNVSIDCSYIAGMRDDGTPIRWGALEDKRFTRRAGDGKDVPKK